MTVKMLIGEVNFSDVIAAPDKDPNMNYRRPWPCYESSENMESAERKMRGEKCTLWRPGPVPGDTSDGKGMWRVGKSQHCRFAP